MWDNLLMFNVFVWFKINMWKIYVEQFLHVSSFYVILCGLCEKFMWDNFFIFTLFVWFMIIV